jgi:lysophospholipase L1-like esterase
MNGLIRNRILIATTIVIALAGFVYTSQAQEDRWAGAMKAFAEADKASPPPQNHVVFTGSSSIRRWDLEEWFPGRNYINRGFGGSQISDAIRHVDAVVNNYRPRLVVFYSGDNDTNAGKSAATVFADFKTFAGLVHSKLPHTRIAVISIKPSVARWSKVDELRKANKMISEWAAVTDYVGYVDIEGSMLGWDGTPNPDLLVEDGLHMRPPGYAIWTAALNPFLK